MQNSEVERSKARILPVPRVASAISLSKSGVTNANGDDLGRVEDIMIDLESGRIAFVVISFGGTFTREPKLLAVPWEVVRISLHDKKMILNVTKETLTDAPSFQKNNWPDLTNLSWLQKVYAFYDSRPYWND
jgi:sporulation protein YlmC with PRC-barrel domain